MRSVDVRAVLFVVAVSAVASESATAADPSAASRLAEAGQGLYREGRLGEALLKFEEAIQAGATGGELFYQTGHCYKMARQDAEKSREYMAKAVPLLEAAGTATPAPLYYLSVIHSMELGDAARGQEAARRGVALAEQGKFAGLTDGLSLFQIGRLYSLAGDRGKAIAWYEKAVNALEPKGASGREYLRQALEQISQDSIAKSDWPRVADALGRLVVLDPEDEQMRTSAGLAMIRAGRYDDALKTLETGFKSDQFATEANYTVHVLAKYIGLKRPPLPSGSDKLDDEKLLEATRSAAVKLGEIRQKEEPPPPPAPAERPYKTIKTKGGKEIKIYEPYLKRPPEDWQPKDPNNPTIEEQRYAMGLPPPVPPRPEAPASAERVAAEKEFFGLLIETLRRGRLLRDQAFQGGYATLIFK